MSHVLLTAGAILTAAFLYGVMSGASEMKQVWSMLHGQFGISDTDVPTDIGETGAPGALCLFDQSFVGRSEVLDGGIVFRRQFLRRHEGICFPQERVSNLRVNPDGRSASFKLLRTAGLPIAVTVPWSPEMSAKWDLIADLANEEGERTIRG